MIDAGALFHDEGRRRLSLWRRWDYDALELVVIGLNPSTADAQIDDPTVTRLRNRTDLLGLGGFRIVNLADVVCTDSRKLKSFKQPCSPRNLEVLKNALNPAASNVILCAWGAEGPKCAPESVDLVMNLAKENKQTLYCLGRNDDGTPTHPLYQKMAGWSAMEWFGGEPPF